MNQTHPGDIEIQQFVFDNADCQIDVAGHIRSCEFCTARAAVYMAMNEELRHLPTPAFEFDIESIVFPHIQIAQVPPKERWIGYFAVAITALALIFTGYFFGDSLLILLGRNSVPATALIVTTACLLVVFAIVDEYRQFKRSMNVMENTGKIAT